MSENRSPAQSDWDAPAGQSPEPAHAQPAPWYRRRPGQVAVAGVTVTAVVLGSLAFVAMAKAEPAPADALAQAAQALAEEPFAVTMTSDEEEGSVRLVHTDKGTQVSVASADGTFEGAYANERLYLRIQPTDSGAMGLDPMMSGFLAGFSSIDALLKGQWVSLDVAEESGVLDALNDLPGAQESTDDEAKVQAASEEFGRSLQGIVDELRGPVVEAVTASSEVTEPPAAGAERHLHLALDVDELQAELEAPVSAAMEDVITAVEDFAVDAGMALPPGIGDPSILRDKLQEAHGKSDDAEVEVATADFYLTDGGFSRIEAEGMHLAFDADPKLTTGIETAVSMDQDLLRLLPMLTSLMQQTSTLGAA